MLKTMLTVMPVSTAPCSAAFRTLPSRPEVESFSVRFNGEQIMGFGAVIDARTSGEKDADEKRGAPAGPVIVFFQGHAQRPDDAFDFTSRLAVLCRSGMVIVPVCDTPCGADPGLHGDTGKDVILMEMVRFMLARKGISISGHAPGSGRTASISGMHPEAEQGMETHLATVGWSHGGILARRFAHAYPGSIRWLGQVCPAGYGKWGALRLAGRFAGESMRISRSAFPDNTSKVLRSGWGFAKGFFGDLCRSVSAAVHDRDIRKAGRVVKDIEDCTLYCDSSEFRAAHLHRIAVLFGREDSCMDQWRQLAIKDPEHIDKEELKRFQEVFFSDTAGSGTFPELRVMPGNHLAPVIHSELYAETLLSILDQMTET
jgi:hypothetical protein